MQRFILIRFLQSLLALFVLSVVVFFATWVTGDPVDYILPPQETTFEEKEALAEKLGLDRPVPVQYITTSGAFSNLISDTPLATDVCQLPK